MNLNYMTRSELDALNDTKLTRVIPFLIRGVMTSQFSVARHYGGITLQGSNYTYFPESDELIRDDVLKWLVKYRKEQKIEPAVVESAGLF